MVRGPLYMVTQFFVWLFDHNIDTKSSLYGTFEGAMHKNAVSIHVMLEVFTPVLTYYTILVLISTSRFQSCLRGLNSLLSLVNDLVLLFLLRFLFANFTIFEIYDINKELKRFYFVVENRRCTTPVPVDTFPRLQVRDESDSHRVKKQEWSST